MKKFFLFFFLAGSYGMTCAAGAGSDVECQARIERLAPKLFTTFELFRQIRPTSQELNAALELLEKIDALGCHPNVVQEEILPSTLLYPTHAQLVQEWKVRLEEWRQRRENTVNEIERADNNFARAHKAYRALSTQDRIHAAYFLARLEESARNSDNFIRDVAVVQEKRGALAALDRSLAWVLPCLEAEAEGKVQRLMDGKSRVVTYFSYLEERLTAIRAAPHEPQRQEVVAQYCALPSDYQIIDPLLDPLNTVKKHVAEVYACLEGERALDAMLDGYCAATRSIIKREVAAAYEAYKSADKTHGGDKLSLLSKRIELMKRAFAGHPPDAPAPRSGSSMSGATAASAGSSMSVSSVASLGAGTGAMAFAAVVLEAMVRHKRTAPRDKRGDIIPFKDFFLTDIRTFDFTSPSTWFKIAVGGALFGVVYKSLIAG